MTIVNILQDGTVYPPLKKGDLLASIVNGKLMQLGRYDRAVFIKRGKDFIEEPEAASDMKKELIPLINSSMPEILNRQSSFYILCPENIFKKVALRYPDVIR